MPSFLRRRFWISEKARTPFLDGTSLFKFFLKCNFPQNVFFLAEPVVERRRRLRVLVEHPGVDLRREQVVGGGDGVDVAGQVQVELVHGDHLRFEKYSYFPYEDEKDFENNRIY